MNGIIDNLRKTVLLIDREVKAIEQRIKNEKELKKYEQSYDNLSLSASEYTIVFLNTQKETLKTVRLNLLKQIQDINRIYKQ